MAAEGQEIVRICDCLCGRVIESGALKDEGKEENVVYCIPSKRAGYVALGDSSLGQEEDVLCSQCRTPTVWMAWEWSCAAAGCVSGYWCGSLGFWVRSSMLCLARSSSA